MHIKHCLESGRTMLEILIVVALVGLLSLLPLEIYNYAIDKYRSNVLKDEILQRSADLKQQIDNHKKNFNLDKWEPYSKIGMPIDIVENDAYEQNSIGIQITHIEKRICNMTLDGLENLEKIRVNDILYNADAKSLCKGNDKITLYFNLIPSHSIRKKSLEDCPANTPKNADPNTCECDLTQRYLQEATNECVCWSGEEIDGVCMNFCATSADCDDNEICENHICIKYDNTTTMEPMNTTEVLETTYTTSTATPETTSTSSTPLSSTTTASVYETSAYETTSVETTTSDYFETTTSVIHCTDNFPYWDGIQCTICPDDTPYWNGSQCVSCADHFGDKAPYWDGTECVGCEGLIKDNVGIGYRPYWNTQLKRCQICPGAQMWDNSIKVCVTCQGKKIAYGSGPYRCVMCYEDKKLYNPFTKKCEGCPSGMKWDHNSQLCQYCPDNYIGHGSECMQCPPGTFSKKEDATCLRCTAFAEKYNTDKPYWDTKTKQCVSTCPDNNPYPQLITKDSEDYFECGPCPIGTNWNGNKCETCADKNPSTPYWDNVQKQCLKTCPTERPYWNGTQCTTCPSATPYWNGSQCVTCASINSQKTYWDSSTKQCICPTDKPYWNGSQCVPCASLGSGYYYNSDTKQCVYCANTWYQNKCFIPSSCSNFGLSQGYKIDSTNGGCHGLKGQNKGFIAWCDRDHPGPCQVAASGYIMIPQSGTYTFFASEVLGDSGIINSYTAYIDGYKIYYTKNGGQEGSKEPTFSTYLSAGLHRYSVSFNLSRRIAAGLYPISGNAMLCY